MLCRILRNGHATHVHRTGFSSPFRRAHTSQKNITKQDHKLHPAQAKTGDIQRVTKGTEIPFPTKTSPSTPKPLIQSQQPSPGRFKLYAGIFVIVTILGGGVAATYAAKLDADSLGVKKLRNDGPPGKFETSARTIRVASKPSKDREWSSYMPEWSPIQDRITDVLLPEWANSLPGFLDKLQSELSAGSGTLAEEMWNEAQDSNLHPEIARPAVVRVSNELCPEEQKFLYQRKFHTRKALARYLDLTEVDVHEDDVPTIAMCGSGGGLRAMVVGASSYYSAQKAGLFDCVTYTAGVSGSCWLQSLYFSTITGQKLDRLLQHLKDRLSVHIAYPPEFLKLITGAPTNKFLMSGGYEKYRGVENPDFGLVDVYGLMLGARLLVPKGDLAVDNSNLKLSNQTKYVDGGQHPLPIYTAVRHEIPAEDVVHRAEEEVKEKAKKEAWFQWFEFTPYEFFCEELEAGIPTWSVGRQFEHGRGKFGENGLALPEIRVPLLLGIYASAFCATLSHYYKEVAPLLKGLTGFSDFDKMMKSRDEDLVKLHPIDPAEVPNFALNMKDQLPKSCPESIHTSPNIQLMDAGMSNNLPIYPLLRPGRDVDIIIAFDASADIKQDNWLKVTDGYARQRGIRGWPIGTGWSDDSDKGPEESSAALDEAEKDSKAQAVAQMDQAAEDHEHKKAAKHEQVAASLDEKSSEKHATDLGHCNIWVGTTEERTSDGEPPRSKQVEKDMELMSPDAGIAVIYFPFMANPKVEGVDPQKSEYMSTWNFIYTPEQIDNVVRLAQTNFLEGEEKVKMCIRAVYERKKAQRLEREKREQQSTRWWQLLD